MESALKSQSLSRAESEALALAKAHFLAIAHIEANLFEPMTVKSIAAQSGFSPSRFSRGFTRLQGESVMAYLRGRRLEGAMRRILTEPGLRMVDLAFDCGFDSQEAFTRAFMRAFGLTPGRFKINGGTYPLVRKRKTHKECPDIVKSIARLPETKLAGLAKRFTPANFVEMSDLWHRVVTLKGFKGQLNDDSYGVRRRRYREDGSFDFVAAVQIEPDCRPPDPLEVITLPPSKYLLFRHFLHEGDLYPQMTAASDLIWSSYVPHSGHVLADGPDFQLYPANFKVKDGWIDHYFPIQE